MFEVNYLKLGLSIFISVLFSGSALIFLNGYVQSEMVEPPQPIIKFIERPVPVNNIQPNVVSTLNQLDKLNQKKASIRATNQETCEYWRSEYNKNKNQLNKNRMQSACARARNY